MSDRPDQLDVQIEMCVRAIRRRVQLWRDHVAQWEPDPMPDTFR